MQMRLCTVNPELKAMLAHSQEMTRTVLRMVKEEKYMQAVYYIKQAIALVVGDGFEVPLYSKEGGGLRSSKYLGLSIRKQVMMMGHCYVMGKMYLVMGKDEEVCAALLYRHDSGY